MDIGPQYSDYLGWFNSRQGSEGNAHPMSQAEFDALPADQKWFHVSGGLDLRPGDPRYQALQGSVPNLEPGRAIGVTPGDSLGADFTNRFVNGENSLYKGDGWYASAANQLTPAAQRVKPWSEGIGPYGLALVLGGAALGNGLLGAGGSGALTGSPAGEAPWWAGTDTSMLSPITAPTVGSLSGAPGPLSALLSGDISGAAGSLGSWAMSNPLQALGAAQTLGGLLGGGGGSPSSGGDSGGSTKGGSGSGPGKSMRPPWTPNPVTAQQLQNFRFTGG